MVLAHARKVESKHLNPADEQKHPGQKCVSLPTLPIPLLATMLVFAVRHPVNGQPGTNQCMDLSPGSKAAASAAGLARRQIP